MRILIVGAESNYAIERSYIKYLSRINQVTHIEFFAAQNRFLQYYGRGVLQKIMYRSGLSSILKKINNELLETVSSNKPDVILVFKGMEVFQETLKGIRAKGIKLANYNPDNPFLFSGKGSGNKNITQSIGLYDLHFTYDAGIKQRIENEFGIATTILPFGFDLSTQLFETCKEQEEVMKVCFLGSPDKHRAAFINRLARNKFSIDVYGQGWLKFIDQENVQIFDAVYGDTFWKTLRRYRVQLNLMRPHNPQSHNMRTFEVPGVGGIQLAPDTVDHRTYFTPNKDIYLFDSLVDCSNQIRDLLSISSASASAIRDVARERSLLSGYSYKHRADQVFKELLKLVNG
jgi:spore maturation protein CgeB